MELSDYDYSLEESRIAQRPLKNRDDSKLLILAPHLMEHKKFNNIINYFSKGDVLVLNNSKVFPAKLKGVKDTGGKVEVLLIKEVAPQKWECLIQGRNVESKTLHFEHVEGKVTRGGSKTFIQFSQKIYLEQMGKPPLPPYIKEEAELERYNTVYSSTEGSIAAPTAGLHFTKEVLELLEQKGVVITYLTLHIGLGTFLPVKTEKIENHDMHSEWFSIPQETARKINNREGGLVVVGTSTIRALESATDDRGKVHPLTNNTQLFIHPPYKWKLSYKGLITNFHLPKSTLLMLVSSFLSKKRIKEAYEEAMKREYKFYSFGDAMLILPSSDY